MIQFVERTISCSIVLRCKYEEEVVGAGAGKDGMNVAVPTGGMPG